MDKCIQALPSTGSGITPLLYMTVLLLSLGVVAMRASRHNSGRLMAVGLPIISVLSFSAPSTQTVDDCPPKEATATTIAGTPSTTTTLPAVTTTSIAATTTTIATQSELKIVFLGQISRGVNSSFGPLLKGNVIFCPEDTDDVPLCVTFFPGRIPDDFETRNLRIADEWQLISLSCNLVRLYDRSVTFNEAFNKSVSPIAATGANAGLTTRPLTNSDTVYIVADDEGCPL